MQECRVSHCLASAHIPGLVDLQRIQTLQKFVQNRDDTDKESVSNRCGHCGAFVSVGALLAHSAQPGQDIILFTDTFFGPLDRDVVVGGKGFHPVLVVIGTLSDQLLAQDGNSEHLAKEMNHLLGPRQSAQIAVDDDPVKAVVNKEQKLTKELLEQFHGTLILLRNWRTT